MARTCAECRATAVEQAEARAAANRARGESRAQGTMERPTLTFPWQRDAFDAWKDGGRTGLVALSPGLPLGDLGFAVIADLIDASRTSNVLVACTPTERDGIMSMLQDRFGLEPTGLVDHHFLEPTQDGTLVVADMEELRTVELRKWGRFASTGLLVLLDADGVGRDFGRMLLDTPFASRFCLTRQPSAMDLLVSRPWAPGFGPLVYRSTEEYARDLGVLPRMKYRLHVEMLKAEGKDHGPVGPWDPTEIPTRIPPVASTPFMRGKARDVATARGGQDQELVIVHEGVPIRGAGMTCTMADLPQSYDSPPSGWLLADPALGVRDVLRAATIGWKTANGPASIEDVVVLPVPADVCQMPPWQDRWAQSARQLDRVAISLLLAEDPGAAMMPEELEILVGVALALRGIPVDELHNLAPVVEQACLLASEGGKIAPDEVQTAARTHGGLAAALLVVAEEGPAALLRLAHPGFTPAVPDLPHPSLYDARRHAWRGRAFMLLANAAAKDDLVTAWGRYPELRFIFPSSLLLEAATSYCKRHRLKGPLDDTQLRRIDDNTKIAEGNRDAAIGVLRQWNDALGVAEEHEREFLAKMHAKQPERERAREGMCLPELSVAHKDRNMVVLDSKRGRFPNTNISPGSEVAIVASRDREEVCRGLVSRISHRSVTIEFPAGTPHRLPPKCTVNLVFDAKVFEAYHSAVHGAQHALSATTRKDDGPDGLIRAALLGEEPGPIIKQGLDLPNLTPTQQEAINQVLQGGRVRLIHGPPGTGKTHTLTHLAMALSRAGHSVLVTADSNAAVDNLVVGMRRNGALAVRIGHSPNIRDKAAEACRIDPMDAPPFVRWAAEQGIVVATTNYGAYRYIDKAGSSNPFVFDYVIHDEAGQSTAPSSLAAVMRGRRLVLAGDPLQLPPTVVSMDAKQAGLDVTLFERIEELTGEDRTNLIATQFRMRDEIVRFSNDRYYDGRIETAPSAASQEVLEGLPPAAFQHITGKENPRAKNGSISNDWEVEGVAAVIAELRSDLRDKGWTLAVLTPYQAQREAIRRRLPDVEVSTVDGAQGREWDVVLYSAVRSNPRHRLGFVADERRLNVAVTRARRHFILVADERTVSDHDGFRDLIAGCEKIRVRYEAPAQGHQGHRGRQGQAPRRAPRRGNPERAKPRQQGNNPPAANPDGPPKNKRRRRRRRRAGDDSDDQAASQDAPVAQKAAPKPVRDVAPKPSPPKPTDGRCKASTKSGERCKNKAKPGSAACARHQ